MTQTIVNSHVDCRRSRDIYFTPAFIYTLLFSSLEILFMRYSFHHSSFYLYIIIFILFVTPDSTCKHIVIFSFIQLLFIKYYFYSSSYCLYSIIFNHPDSMYTVLFSVNRLLFIQYSFHSSSFYFSRRIVASPWCTAVAVYSVFSIPIAFSDDMFFSFWDFVFSMFWHDFNSFEISWDSVVQIFFLVYTLLIAVYLLDPS